MNVKVFWPDRVESYDTRDDGEAAHAKAWLAWEANGFSVYNLKLWSQLYYDSESEATRGWPMTLFGGVAMDEKPKDIIDLLEGAGRGAVREGEDEVVKLLRFDVDGETLWDADPDE